ncbi:MAG: hypothetical protein J6X34_06055, partial [Clostridia bacterium]|nr:hypothetical protein [Clostridia bacterium]
HPLRPSKSLNTEELKRLVKAIKTILHAAIKAQGTDFGDNVVSGDYSPKIYGRNNKAANDKKKQHRTIVAVLFLLNFNDQFQPIRNQKALFFMKTTAAPIARTAITANIATVTSPVAG